MEQAIETQEQKWYVVTDRADQKTKLINDPKAVSWSMMSGPFDTEEEACKGNHILKEPCRECGGLVSTSYNNRDQLIERNLCYGCDLWTDRVQLVKEDPTRIIVGGQMYSIGSEDPNNVCRGYGGRQFIFTLHTGQVIKSTNTWFGGEVPAHFRDRLPDNAKFGDL
jgi:hypothetical protein